MRILAALALTCAVLAAGQPSPTRARVTRTDVKALDESFDVRLRSLWPDDPVNVLGVTQGVYIGGYGAVFTAEVNVAPSAGITPFHPAVSKDEVVRIHQKKAQRIEKLKDAMREMLISSAARLDGIPDDEQITLAVSLFHWNWEDTAGLPEQIVMHAQKKMLAGVQAKRVDPAVLTAALKVEQF